MMDQAQANVGTPLRILFVEDSGEDTAILLQALRDGGFEPQFERVDTAEAMRRALADSVWDAVICDHAIPHFAIPEALKVLQESEHDLPFIVVAGRTGEESAIELMKASAHDFVMKDNLERLVPALSREMTAAELRRQHTLAQALLGESDSRFRTLAAASPVGIFHTDAAGRCFYVNERWTQMTGMAPAAALEKGWEAAVHPDDREQVVAERDRCLAQNRPFFMEFRLRRPDGAVVWVLGRIEGQAGDTGRVATWIGTVTDVTRLKTTQFQLTERVKEQRCLYSISILAARIDLAEQDLLRESLPVIAAGFQYPDITCARIYLEGREFAGETFREAPWVLASELRIGGAPAGRIEVCYRQERPAEAEGPFLAEERALLDTVARTLGRAIESRRSLDALSASEHHLREAQRIARLGSWTWDIEPDIVTWTRELYLIAGKDPALPAPNIAEQQSLYTPESWDRLSAALERCISQGESFELDLEVPRPEGNRWATVRGHAHRDEHGNIVRLQGTAMDITERKLAELAVESDQRRFRALTENASDLVVIVDANGIITYTSPSLARLGGYAAGDARGRNFLEFLHPDDKAAGTQAMMKVLEQPDVPVVSELRFRHRDGHYVVLESASKNVLADPAVAGIVVNARDISERKAAEVEITASEVRYRRLFEAARDGILIVNVDSGQIVDVNPFMIELLGYTREQYVDRKLWDIGPFKDVIASKAAFVELQKNRYVRHDDLPLRTVDGRNIDVEFVSNVYEVDGGEVIQCNIRDITERKRTDEALRASRNLLAAIVENAPIRLFWKDKELRYLGCNSAFARDAGMSQPEDLLGKDDFQMGWSKQAERYRADDRQVIDTGSAKLGIEEPQTTPDGTEIWLRTSKVPLYDADGKVFGLLGIYEDITERKHAEVEIRRMNWALRALSQSNSALVHADSVEELFQSCCESITDAEVYPLAWIGLARDEPGQPVVPAAVAGEAAAYVESVKATWDDSPTGRGPAGTAIRTGVTQVVNDLESHASFAPWLYRAREHGLASSISLPISHNGSVLGALMVYSREVNAFEKDQVDLFEELADDVGFGIVALRTRHAYEAGLIERGKQAVKLREIMESAIEALAATVEQRDPYTGGHQRRVADLAVAIGREMGLAEEQLAGLHVASVIHDIGKIYVPAEILARPGRLSDAEFEIVKSHPQVGYDIIKGVDFPWPVAQTIYQHHERLDGSGYPLGVKGDEIIVEARILAVADIVEAMSSHRPYRTGLGLDVALEQVQKEAGSKLDSAAVQACVRLFREKGYKLSE